MTNDQIIQDFRRRYEQTYVLLNLEAKKTEVLARVAQVSNSDSKTGVIFFETQDYGLLSLNMGSEGHSMRSFWPKSGVFQLEDRAAVFWRWPRKQYQRGISANNCLIHPVTRPYIGGAFSCNFVNLGYAHRHVTFTVEQALKFLNGNSASSVALDGDLSISLSFTGSPDYMILHYTHVIARCNPKGRLTHVYEKVYLPTLQRLFEAK